METNLDMGSENLLSIEPQELKFNFEVGKQSSCTIRLTNNTRQRVAFKLMTTSPGKYCVRPNVGIISPRSSLDVHVTMNAPTENPTNMQCKDKFLIKSVIASSADSIESARKMFSETWRQILQCKLKVVYNIPSDRPSSHPETSEPVVYSPPATSISQAKNLDNSEVKHEQDRNENGGLELFMKVVAIGLLVLVSYYLIVKILPFIWSLTFMLSMLVIKMVQKLVSDSAEDWIVTALLKAFVLLFSALYARLWNKNDNARSQ